MSTAPEEGTRILAGGGGVSSTPQIKRVLSYRRALSLEQSQPAVDLEVRANRFSFICHLAIRLNLIPSFCRVRGKV